MGLRFAVISAKPEASVVVEVARLPKPAALAQVVAEGATDRVVRPCVLDRRDELGHHEAVSGLLDVLAIRPPAEIVDLLEFGFGTFEERDVVLHPSPRR